MCKLEQIAIRLDNDVNGNPRYYFGMFELARLLGVDVDTLEKHRQGLGFTRYTGSKYGYGYIISSEQLEKSLEQKKYILHLALAVEQAMPEYEVRIEYGRIEQKIAYRWKPYSGEALNLMDGYEHGLCYE